MSTSEVFSESDLFCADVKIHLLFFYPLQSGLPNGIFPPALMLLYPPPSKDTLGMSVSSLHTECEIFLNQGAEGQSGFSIKEQPCWTCGTFEMQEFSSGYLQTGFIPKVLV